MKLSPFKISLFILPVLLLASCDWLNSDTDVSSNPCFYSLTFSEDDSIPGLEDAEFTVQWDDLLLDSVIVNVDSLPYLTDIDSVVSTFVFYSTSSAYICMTDTTGTKIDTLDISSLSDTLDFNRVISITNIATDEITSKTYPIKVNVHKVDPEQYQWRKIYDQIYSHSGSVQKAIYFNDLIFFYVNSGINNYLYTSTDGSSWSTKSVTGLPKQALLRNIYEYNNKLYMFQDESSVYTSEDGYSWVKLDYSTQDYNLINYLFILNGKAWSIVKSKTDNVYRFAYSADGATWITGSDMPDNFPIGDFAATSFKSRTNLSKAVVAGGYSKTGVLLNNVWSTENGSYWVDFSTENLTFGSLAGASILYYDNKLLMFGGMDNDGYLLDDKIIQSIDEGFLWSAPDSTENYLHQVDITSTVVSWNKTTYDTSYVEYPNRSYQSVLYVTKESTTGLFTDHFIYLIGGHDRSTVYSDVWKGHLNRLSFIRQDGDDY
jgi:hypothetical protein